MKIKHNKKRNTGLLYEMLLSFIAENVINNKTARAQKAVKIIERRFKKNSELFKELRLFNALFNSTLSSTHSAAGVLVEAKNICHSINYEKLRKEKSLLIKDINHQLKDKNFYNRKISNYVSYANIHNMLSEWRKKDKDLLKIVNCEKLVVSHLINENKNVSETLNCDSASDALVFKIMTEKINNRYEKELTKEQRNIVRMYALEKTSSDDLKYFLEGIKQDTIDHILKYKKSCDNKILKNKYNSVIGKIREIKSIDVNDDDIKKYLTLSNLKNEVIND